MTESGKSAGQGEMNRRSACQWIQDAIDEHEGPLVRYANSLLRDLDRARDVVQDTFMQMLKLKQDELTGSLRPWLFKVCRNRAIDVCRKESRMRSTDSLMLDQQINGNQNPSVVLEQKEASRHVQTLIENLNPRQQEILRLKFQSSLSYKEIAEVMGLSVSNVGFILHKAIQKVRQKATAEFGLGTE